MKTLLAVAAGVLLAQLLEQFGGLFWGHLAAYLRWRKAYALWWLGVKLPWRIYWRWRWRSCWLRLRWPFVSLGYRVAIGFLVGCEFCSKLRCCLFHKFQCVKPKPLPVVGRLRNVNTSDRHMYPNH